MTAAYFQQRVLKHWWFIVLCVALAMLGAVAEVVLVAPTYVARARLAVSQTSIVITAEESAHVNSTPFLAKVAASLPGVSVATLKTEVTSTPVPGTVYFDVFVSDHSPSRAALIANTIAQALVVDARDSQEQPNLVARQMMESAVSDAQTSLNDAITHFNQLEASGAASPHELMIAKATMNEMETRYLDTTQAMVNLQLKQAIQYYLLTIEQPATVEAETVKPSHTLVISLALGIGVLAGILGLLLSDLFVDYVRPLTNLANDVPWEALGRVKARPGGVVAIPDDREGFQGALNSLRFVDLAEPARRIAVVGLGRTDAASEVAAGLALAAAASELRTLLIDAAFPQGTQAQRFGANAQPGLTEALLEARERGDAAAPGQYLQSPNTVAMRDLRLLTTGNAPAISAKVAGASALTTQVYALAQRIGAQITIIDLAAPGRLREMAHLASGADAVVVVVDLRTARRADVTRANNALTAAQANVVGYVVAESADSSAPIRARDARAQGKVVKAVAP